MPAREIKELRHAGKLEEAYAMAKSEFEADSTNIWCKRNISWVYYDYIKLTSTPENSGQFLNWLDAIRQLQMTADEGMLFDNLSWQIGKMIFGLVKLEVNTLDTSYKIFDSIKDFYFTKPSLGYSYLFKAFHKSFKNTDYYCQFLDWWGFHNFMAEDYLKTKNQNGKEIMSIAEQAIIAYSKQLLPKKDISGQIVFNTEKAESFLPILEKLEQEFPQFIYTGYFHAKLILALGNKDNLLSTLLPFARKKKNEFWVWDIMADAFSPDLDKIFYCYCKGLSCPAPEEMLINLRQKLARILIEDKQFDVAKTEINLLVETRIKNKFSIPDEVLNWQKADWYAEAKDLKSNTNYYKLFDEDSNALLYDELPEELIIVDFINTEKSVFNFITSDLRTGYIKYDNLFVNLNVGSVFSVRFKSFKNEGFCKCYSAVQAKNKDFYSKFVKEVSGSVTINTGKSFGFLKDAYISPALVIKYELSDGKFFHGEAINAYNSRDKTFSWRLM